MHPLRRLSAAALVWGLTMLSSPAEIIGVETFDYPDGAIAGQTGGTFWDYKNTVAAGHDGTASNWNNLSGAPAVFLGRLKTRGSSAKREFNGPPEGSGTEEDNGAFSDGRVNQVLYVRVSFSPAASYKPTLPDFVGISLFDFGVERLFFGKRFQQPVFGIQTTNGFGFADSSVPVEKNTAYTLVAKVDYPNNQVSLFINPVLGGAEPAPDAAISNYTTNNFSTSVRLASGSGDAVSWDNLFVATSWAELGTVVTTTADENDGSLVPTANGGQGISLREAINYGAPGSWVTFADSVMGRSFTLTRGALQVNRAVTIDASGLGVQSQVTGEDFLLSMSAAQSPVTYSLAHGVVVDGNLDSNHFNIAAGASLSARNLNLIRGVAGLQNGGSITNSGSLSLLRCSILDNTAATVGAIWQKGTSCRLDRCTLSGNRTTGGASVGAIGATAGQTTLVHCTISKNTGRGQSGGVLWQSPATMSMGGCIIAGNADPLSPKTDLTSPTPSSAIVTAPCLIGSNLGAATSFPAGPLVGTSTAPLNPRLSAPGYFGGGTLTMHPLIGSPAIDAAGTANPGGIDQRGLPVFVDGDADNTAALDIGAVEAGPLTQVTVAGDGFGPNLRTRLANATVPGTRLGFGPLVRGETIVLSKGPLPIPSGGNVFIDASNLTTPVTISQGGNNRLFFVESGGTLAMTNLRLINGSAPPLKGLHLSSGGAILSFGSLTVLGCVLDGNRAGNFFSSNRSDDYEVEGGGAIESDGAAMIADSVIQNNHGGENTQIDAPGGRGGGIRNIGLLFLQRCRLVGNYAGDGYLGGEGGGLYTTGAAFVSESTFSGNQGGAGNSLLGDGGSGGGIYNSWDASGVLKVHACTFDRNLAGIGFGDGGSGGGISARGCAYISSSTLAGNGTGLGGFGRPGKGGAISGEVKLEVAHCTVVGNYGYDTLYLSGGGGIFTAPGGSHVIRQSIVSGNYIVEPGNTTRPSQIDATSATQTNNFLGGDPKLAPLSDYGGPTFTMLPLPGSPVINAATASNTLWDQRGVGLNSVPDIGAVEVQAALSGFTDTDSDGMDDRLEPLYGFIIGVNDGSLDADADGSPNKEELGNLTGPRDPESLLKILSFTKTGNNFTFTHTSFPGLSYSFEYGSTLNLGSSLGLGTATGMTSGNTVGPLPANRAFFRIRRN